ncbi:MAG: OsmC family protein [Bacteroidia bacterium]|nr:OsmC family protein [Bacteroidia bacterium]MDW8334826.1 OsmC family protein [Bacteroidia bacterium]
MKIAVVEYAGELATRMIHERSSSVVVTDAPPDNMGRGSAFSPTDLVAAGLAACMTTVLAIKMKQGRFPPLKLRTEVQKVMSAVPPRKIARIVLDVFVEGPLSVQDRPEFEATAHSCPVALSLSPEIEIEARFHYD